MATKKFSTLLSNAIGDFLAPKNLKQKLKHTRQIAGNSRRWFL